MRRQRQPLAFNPERVAHYEKAGWQAYYDRNWPKAFWLLVRGNRELFRMAWPRALSAALDTVRASIAFAPLEDNDVPTAQRHMASFYQKARRSVDIAADAPTLARLEMDYWVVHRRLAIERKEQPDRDNHEPLVESLAALHTALFGGSEAVMRRSAEWRAAAAVAVDRITGNYSADVAADWLEVERCLREAYRLVREDSDHDAYP
jgi:hypothetical protein